MLMGSNERVDYRDFEVRGRAIRRCLKRHLARRIFKLLRLGVNSL